MKVDAQTITSVLCTKKRITIRELLREIDGLYFYYYSTKPQALAGLFLQHTSERAELVVLEEEWGTFPSNSVDPYTFDSRQ